MPEWKLLAEKLALKPIFAAKLLAGEMPGNIDSVFKDVWLSLFPERLDDLETDCSCPDWSNPCKHVVAVYYLLEEEFDRDPFLIFKLRGCRYGRLISILMKGFVPETAYQVAETGTLIEQLGGKTGTAIEAEVSSISPEPLPFDPETFWGGFPENPEGEKSQSLEAHIPPVPANLPKRLGKFPF